MLLWIAVIAIRIQNRFEMANLAFYSYLHTECWCYRECRNWHHGQNRCPEDRVHMRRSQGLDWKIPAYTENTLMCRQHLSGAEKIERRSNCLIYFVVIFYKEKKKKAKVTTNPQYEYFSAVQDSPLFFPSQHHQSSSKGCWCQISGSPRIHISMHHQLGIKY